MSPRQASFLVQTMFWLACLLLILAPIPAEAAGTIWRVTIAGDDATAGDLAAHTGTVRFALEHAVAGDSVVFGSLPVDTIYLSSSLTVPPGVALGGSRVQDCGGYNTPMIALADPTLNVAGSLNPIITLGAGATLRHVGLMGGLNAVLVAGANVDICGVGIGRTVDGDGVALTQPPWNTALVIDGDHASVRQSYIDGAIVVTTRASDTRLGDTLTGSGDQDGGVRDASVTVLADANGAAQRVTIRDPFPRTLHGMVGTGVFGGDDSLNHANNWAQTPTIISALTSDHFATAQIYGVANPNSQVDIFFDNQIDIVRQAPVMADATGNFSFSGPLPAGTVQAIAVSTLASPVSPGRLGSSSQWSAAVPVHAATGTPELAATAAFTNLTTGANVAHADETLRVTISMTNTGSTNVTGIGGAGFSLPASLQLVSGSSKMTGGSGFAFTSTSFSGGTIDVGQHATFTLDVVVAKAAPKGTAIFSGEVVSTGSVSIPVIARATITTLPTQNQWFAWLPLIVH